MGNIKKDLVELINKIDDEKFLNNLIFIIRGYMLNKKK